MRGVAAAMMCLIAGAAWGQSEDVGTSEYVWSSDLAAQGFTPFAISSASNASFGMMKGTDMYLCFIIDSESAAKIRRDKLLSEMGGETVDRSVPNIPIVCVLTQ